MESLSATLLEIDALSADVKGFKLDLQAQDYDFMPGQWLDLSLEINGKTEVGGYSITSAHSPHPQHISLAVKAAPHHPVTAYLHQQAKVGDTVQISQGQGACVYHPDMGKQIVLIAGGIGITPLISIFRSIRDQEPDTQVALIYSAHAPEDFVFAEEIRSSANEYEHVLAVFTCTDEARTELPDWVHFQEHVDGFFLKSMNLPAQAHYFICGPAPMLSEVEKQLLALEVPAGQIHYEKW